MQILKKSLRYRSFAYIVLLLCICRFGKRIKACGPHVNAIAYQKCQLWPCFQSNSCFHLKRCKPKQCQGKEEPRVKRLCIRKTLTISYNDRSISLVHSHRPYRKRPRFRDADIQDLSTWTGEHPAAVWKESG